MLPILNEDRFSFVSPQDKRFISTYDEAMNQLGYNFGGQIGSGFCWGRFMLIYRKTGVKSDRVYARIYLQENGIVLRLFMSDIDGHRLFIENAPWHIKEVFVGEAGRCKHCHNQVNDDCRFRKTYTIDGQLIEKCNGETFWFCKPELARLDDYLALFTEFYPMKSSQRSTRKE
jgi:hypothetical protein